MNPLDIPFLECQIKDMAKEGIYIEQMPELEEPLLIAGFDGWGNALDLSKAMVSYLIRKLNAQYFGKIDSDLFYRYDENRPLVSIEAGTLKSVSPPGGSFYAVKSGAGKKDLIILRAHEPNLRWIHFENEFFNLCGRLRVETIITLGSMYDNVLHTDRIISALSSSQDINSRLKQKNVIPINYEGPSAIHSSLQAGAERRGFECISLWCHCPYYLQGTPHFGLLAYLGSLLSFLGKFDLDTEELETRWKEINKQIQGLIEKNPDLNNMIDELRKAKVRGSWASIKESPEKSDKVIHLDDFLKPR